MKAVLVTTEVPIQTGGIGTFVYNFARLLRDAGDDVHIILANPTDKPMREWAPVFQKIGVSVSDVFATPLEVPAGYTWHKRVTELTAALVPEDADVVYLADWQSKGFDIARTRRFRKVRVPIIVTVLHGCTKWLREGNKKLSSGEEDLWLDFAESYVAAHSDYVVSPGQYMLDWVKQAGWALPPEQNQRVLGYPFFPRSEPSAEDRQLVMAAVSAASHASVLGVSQERTHLQNRDRISNPNGTRHSDRDGDSQDSGMHLTPHLTADVNTFHRIVFFGRLETRKGLELFVKTVGKLKSRPCMRSIREIVFLGGLASNNIGSPHDVANAMREQVNEWTQVRVYSKFNTFQAQAYLTEHAADSLIVVPSLRENFPLAVIEASLLPGVNLLCSNAGSIPDVLGPNGQDQLFEPFPAPFASKLEETLRRGPQPSDELGHYDWHGANTRWLAFHREVCDAVSQARAEDKVAQSVKPNQPAVLSAAKAVDVCISYYNLAPYLPYMLDSLVRQTSADFNVIVVNDGSTDEEAISVFERMQEKYRNRGWKFITTSNCGLSAARNAGAANGTAEYLIFLDGDDVAAPNLVERFLTSMRCSGDDCLTCYFHLFKGEGWHPSYAHQAHYFYVPTGNSPVIGAISNAFGGACCIVRRSAFDAMGGFTTNVSKFVGYEDYEFYSRLALAGFKLDVLPEFLLFYRTRDDGMLRTNDLYENKARVLRVYEERLREIGMGGLAELAAGVSERAGIMQPYTSPNVDVSFLINQVSGHLVVRSLRIKLRNQLARRLGLPLRLS
jgi:glycosyltransferase involved in cell wall biosynthesis